jgi:hypothetical protein
MPTFIPKNVRQRLAAVYVEVVQGKWMVFASGYCIARWQASASRPGFAGEEGRVGVGGT